MLQIKIDMSSVLLRGDTWATRQYCLLTVARLSPLPSWTIVNMQRKRYLKTHNSIVHSHMYTIFGWTIACNIKCIEWRDQIGAMIILKVRKVWGVASLYIGSISFGVFFNRLKQWRRGGMHNSPCFCCCFYPPSSHESSCCWLDSSFLSSLPSKYRYQESFDAKQD